MTVPLNVALVGCGVRKAPEESGLPAKDLYTGVPFLLAFRYAEATADDVHILSALHGLISPYQCIAPYDMSMVMKSPAEKAAWGRAVCIALEHEYPRTKLHLTFYAGMQYIRPIEQFLPERLGFWTWENPLEGQGLFKRNRWLKEKLDALQERPS
jgi:hypothetical protein